MSVAQCRPLPALAIAASAAALSLSNPTAETVMPSARSLAVAGSAPDGSPSVTTMTRRTRFLDLRSIACAASSPATTSEGSVVECTARDFPPASRRTICAVFPYATMPNWSPCDSSVSFTASRMLSILAAVIARSTTITMACPSSSRWGAAIAFVVISSSTSRTRTLQCYRGHRREILKFRGQPRESPRCRRPSAGALSARRARSGPESPSTS